MLMYAAGPLAKTFGFVPAGTRVMASTVRQTPSPRKGWPFSSSRPLPFTVASWTKMMSFAPSTSPAPPGPSSEAKFWNGEADVPSPADGAEPFTYQIMWVMLIVTVAVELAGMPADGISVAMYWNEPDVARGDGTKLNEP